MDTNDKGTPIPRNWGRLALLYVAINNLVPDPRNPRRHNRGQIRALARSIRRFGFNGVVLINRQKRIIAGHALWLAAKEAGLEEVPTIEINHLQEAEEVLLMIALNRTGDLSSFDDLLLGTLFVELEGLNLDLDLEESGFSVGEIDLLIKGLDDPTGDDGETSAPSTGPAVTRLGDLFSLGGRHFVTCGDATDPATVRRLLSGKLAALATVDMPYNVKILGHVSGNGRIRHAEFLMASGEMTTPEFVAFMKKVITLLVEHTVDGSLHFLFMDWRHLEDLQAACRDVYTSLENICVWVKNGPGLGSMFRSQHEMIAVYKKGRAPHRNNVQLGKFGRTRSNVWQYPGANTFGRASEEGNLLHAHPTPKPVSLVADLILDATARGDIVLDTFLGSGTTVIAAERTGRCCYGLELNPAYVDLIVRRWQKYAGESALHAESGKTFDEIAHERGQADGTL